MVLTKLRSHVEAVLQVIKVLSLSFCLVVQLTTLSVFVFVRRKAWLSSMLPSVAIDALIFNSNARSGSQCLFGQSITTSILLLKVRNVLEVLTLCIVTCQTLICVLLTHSSPELLWILRLNTGDQLAQELLLVINFGVVYDFLH